MSFVDDMDYRYFDPNTGRVVGVKYRENSDGRNQPMNQFKKTRNSAGMIG